MARKVRGIHRVLTKQCSANEREPYLDAVLKTETGKIAITDEGDTDDISRKANRC